MLTVTLPLYQVIQARATQMGRERLIPVGQTDKSMSSTDTTALNGAI
jgi:hypothetical protein